jgi:hypothetical protein
MLLVPTGGGKNTVYKVLSCRLSALANQGQFKVHLHILNLKSIKFLANFMVTIIKQPTIGLMVF